MKKLLVIVFLLTIPAKIFAQDQQSFHFGFKITPSLAWLKSSTKGYESDGSKFGFSYGLITEFNFADRYAFATGLDVTYRGGKLKSEENLKTVNLNEDSSIITTSNYTLQYLEIPLTLKLKTNEIGSIVYFVQLGVAPGINLSAKRSFESSTQTTVGGILYNTSEEEEDIDCQDQINNFNLSMIIGGGLEYTLSGQTVLLAGIQFNNGFLDSFDGNPKILTNYLGLTLGVLF